MEILRWQLASSVGLPAAAWAVQAGQTLPYLSSEPPPGAGLGNFPAESCAKVCGRAEVLLQPSLLYFQTPSESAWYETVLRVCTHADLAA